jgi:hypothetical protein
MFSTNIHVKLAIHFSLEGQIAKNFLYLSKLEAQMVTSTPSENLSLHLNESQNKNFNFGTLKTLILHARSIFFKGGHPTKIWRKKIFFMKTLSKSFDGIYCTFTLGRGVGVGEVREKVEGQKFTRGVENTNMTDCYSL